MERGRKHLFAKLWIISFVSARRFERISSFPLFPSAWTMLNKFFHSGLADPCRTLRISFIWLTEVVVRFFFLFNLTNFVFHFYFRPCLRVYYYYYYFFVFQFISFYAWQFELFSKESSGGDFRAWEGDRWLLRLSQLVVPSWTSLSHKRTFSPQVDPLNTFTIRRVIGLIWSWEVGISRG